MGRQLVHRQEHSNGYYEHQHPNDYYEHQHGYYEHQHLKVRLSTLLQLSLLTREVATVLRISILVRRNSYSRLCGSRFCRNSDGPDFAWSTKRAKFVLNCFRLSCKKKPTCLKSTASGSTFHSRFQTFYVIIISSLCTTPITLFPRVIWRRLSDLWIIYNRLAKLSDKCNPCVIIKRWTHYEYVHNCTHLVIQGWTDYLTITYLIIWHSYVVLCHPYVVVC